MKVLKKLITILLCSALVLGLFSGCGSKKETSTGKSDTTAAKDKSASAESDKPAKPVKILSEITGGKDPDEHELWQKEVERLSGIKIDMTRAPGNDYPTKLAATLASGEDMDIVYMLASDFEKLNKSGLFEPLTEYIENSKVLSDPEVIDPKEWERIRREDGEIYSIFSKYEGGRMPLVRWDWMQKLGLKEPTTLDEYYEVLKAFTTQDPDGNGQNDTYGLTLKNTYDIQPFMSAYGLVDGYAKDENGKWYIPWATEAAAPVYDWLSKLYKEGILDPNFPTNGSSNCREMILSDKAGMFVYWDAWVGLFNDKARAEDPNTAFEIKGLSPVLDKDGNGTITAGQDGLWVMLKSSKNKNAAFKFLEFFHTQEGNMVCSLGIEGHDYTVTDGKYELTEVGKQHAMDHGCVNPKSLKWQSPMPEPMNFGAAKEIVLNYAKPEVLRESTKNAKEIVTKYAVKAIVGDINGEQAVAEMQKELKAKKYID